MADNEISTLDAILSAAKKEFSEKGFQSASLRKIVKDAGVTTGAFYGYYKSKEELFDALVGECYDTILAMFKKVQGYFQKLSPKEQCEKWRAKPAAECAKCWITVMPAKRNSS